jgi:uncharacterized RDD family membrane protein YckC
MSDPDLGNLEFDTVETAENVDLQRALAGMGLRLVAGIVDSLIVYLTILALWLMLVFWASDSPLDLFYMTSSFWPLIVFYIVVFTVYWGYFTLFELLTGRTPGKKTQSLRIARLDGGPVRTTDILIRNLVRVIDSQPVNTYVLGGVVMFISRRSQRLGDLAAGTVVVNERLSREPEAPLEVPQPAQKGQAGQTVLTREEVQIIQRYRQRMDELDAVTRNRIAGKLLLPILRNHCDEVPVLPSSGYLTIESLCFDLLEGRAEAPQPPRPPEEKVNHPVLTQEEVEIIQRYRQRMKNLEEPMRERVATQILLPILRNHRDQVKIPPRSGYLTYERLSFDLLAGRKTEVGPISSTRPWGARR